MLTQHGPDNQEQQHAQKHRQAGLDQKPARSGPQQRQKMPGPASGIYCICTVSSSRRPLFLPRYSSLLIVAGRADQGLGLCNPFIPDDPAIEAFQVMVDPGDLSLGPPGNLVEMVDAQLVAEALQFRADPLDPCQIVRPGVSGRRQQFGPVFLGGRLRIRRGLFFGITVALAASSASATAPSPRPLPSVRA